MIVARHHQNRLVAFREVPQSRQRRLALKHKVHQVDEQPLLLVNHRNGDSVKVIPVGMLITLPGAKKTDQ
ncbi:hypothetical protein Q1M64_08780 (plasmid) [Sinorhizobium meliloti]|nr:hypothetical protein Q1M63_10175 [Sinorhizobium meliloti]WKL40178.1 hypothetical protein Q1M64_08780 [Sinorhizobium meliloti]